MLISEFIKKEQKENLKDIAGVAGGGYLAIQGVRSGVPRALGVRLESHSTGKKQAKQILKNGGYLDPSRYGTKAAAALKELGFNEKEALSKNKVYITGMHPDEVAKYKNQKLGLGEQFQDPAKANRIRLASDPLAQRNHVRSQRKGYRVQGALSSEDLKTQNLIKKKILTKKELNSKDIKTLLGLQLKQSTSTLNGKSLYIGGSDDYFRNNFIPDPDDIAMASSKKIKVHSNRIGATAQAIKREGLGNILKKAPKSRIAVGIGLLGAAGLGTGVALNSANKLKRKYTKKNTSYWNKFK